MLLVAFTTHPVYCELKVSMGASNYLWRGETQTNDGPTVFGNIDSLHHAELYAGTRSSTVDPHRADDYSSTTVDYDSGLVNQDYEWDIYAVYRHRGNDGIRYGVFRLPSLVAIVATPRSPPAGRHCQPIRFFRVLSGHGLQQHLSQILV